MYDAIVLAGGKSKGAGIGNGEYCLLYTSYLLQLDIEEFVNYYYRASMYARFL